jgi:hypothetical protein
MSAGVKVTGKNLLIYQNVFGALLCVLVKSIIELVDRMESIEYRDNDTRCLPKS